MLNYNFLFIGCGNMGEPVLKAILETGIKPTQIYVLENNETQQQKIKDTYHINTDLSLNSKIDFLVLAIKPQQILEIDFSSYNLTTETIVISILAGTSIKKLQTATNLIKIARIMPNLPMMVKTGFSSIITENLNQWEQNFIQNIFTQAGEIINLKQEEDIHASTLLAGSGPGIYYYFCVLMQEIALEYGFSLTEAEKIAKQTFIGSAALLKEMPFNASEMQQKVSSKGGTTEACVNKLKELNLKDILKQGIDAGIKRSKEL